MEAALVCSAVSGGNHVRPHGLRRSLMEYSQLWSHFSYWKFTFPSRWPSPTSWIAYPRADA
jgi:hypothetical protein